MLHQKEMHCYKILQILSRMHTRSLQNYMLSKLEEMESKIGEITQNIDRISKAIDDI